MFRLAIGIAIIRGLAAIIVRAVSLVLHAFR